MVTAPSPSGAASTGLDAVTCLTGWACVAFGFVTDSLPSQPYVMTAPVARSGYRFVASDGGVFAYGAGAPFLGSLGGTTLNAPIVGMAVMPAGDGYYLVAADGGVFNYGSAKFYGSAGSLHLNKPVVGMAITPDGAGYWLVASDGGIFTYGDAAFYGSTGSLKLNKPVVGMAATPDGKGYYLVASDGGIFNYGAAPFQGSSGSLVLNKPVVGMAVPTSGGYYLVASDGGIFTYPTTGGPPFLGSTGCHHAEQANRGDDRRGPRLLPVGLRRRRVHLPDVGWPDLLRVDGLDRAEQAHRRDHRLSDAGRPGASGEVPAARPLLDRGGQVGQGRLHLLRGVAALWSPMARATTTNHGLRWSSQDSVTRQPESVSSNS